MSVWKQLHLEQEVKPFWLNGPKYQEWKIYWKIFCDRGTALELMFATKKAGWSVPPVSCNLHCFSLYISPGHTWLLPGRGPRPHWGSSPCPGGLRPWSAWRGLSHPLQSSRHQLRLWRIREWVLRRHRGQMSGLPRLCWRRSGGPDQVHFSLSERDSLQPELLHLRLVVQRGLFSGTTIPSLWSGQSG